MTWGLVFGVSAIMVGFAALSFVISVRRLKKTQRG